MRPDEGSDHREHINQRATSAHGALAPCGQLIQNYCRTSEFRLKAMTLSHGHVCSALVMGMYVHFCQLSSVNLVHSASLAHSHLTCHLATNCAAGQFKVRSRRSVAPQRQRVQLGNLCLVMLDRVLCSPDLSVSPIPDMIGAIASLLAAFSGMALCCQTPT